MWEKPPGLSFRQAGPDHNFEALSNQLGRRAPVSGQIAETIRNMIIAGDLQPGERIVESRIARQIGVGQPTVREALVALEHQGLVVRKANQGCVVTSLTRAKICHLLRIRAELETLAVELAVENASDDEIGKLLDVTRLMKEAAFHGDPQQFFALDLRFHDALWKLSGNTFLPRLRADAGAALGIFVSSKLAPQPGNRHDGIGGGARRGGEGYFEPLQGDCTAGDAAETKDVRGSTLGMV